MRVLITFEQDAGVEIAQPTADFVWAIESPANRGAAESRWREEPYNGVAVTVFDPEPLADLLSTVLEHHPGCEILEVRGAEADSKVWEELNREGFVPLQPSPGVFRAGKRKGAV